MKKLLIFILAILPFLADAQVIVTPGTWPVMCRGGGYVTQTTPIVIKETNSSDFSVASAAYEIDFPAGYEVLFYAGTVTFYGADGAIVIGTPDFNWYNYNFNFRLNISSTASIDSIVIQGIQVKALASATSPVQLIRINETYATNHVQNGNMIANALSHGTLSSIPNPAPVITFIPDSYYCNANNTNTALTGTPAGGVWSGVGVAANNFNPFGLTVGTKVLSYTINNGANCPNISSTVNVLVKSTPTVSLVSDDADNTICPGTAVTFTATASGSNQRYQFFKNGVPVTSLSTLNSHILFGLANNDAVTVEADNGSLTCSNVSTPITMTVVANPNATITIPTLPSLVCNNDLSNYAIVTSPSGLGSITGSGVSGTNFSPSTAVSGSVTLTYNAIVSGCSFPATISINNVLAPTVTLTSSDANNTICEGDAVTFTANTGGTANRYLFLKNSNGIQGPNGSISYMTMGLIDGDVVSVTVDNGASTCATTSTGIVTTVGKLPKALFSWRSACGQNEITFHDLSSVAGASTLSSWDWDYTNDAVIDYTQLSATPDVVFTYPATNEYNAKLTVTSDKGCIKDTVIRVYTLPGKTPTPSDPYAINFENSNQGWAYDGVNSSWDWGTAPSDFNSTRNIWSTGQNSGDGKYKTAEQSYLYGPCVDLSQLDKPMIAIKVSSKMTGKPSGAILEATNDDGLNWVKLGKLGEGLNWYNDFGIVSTPSSLLANSTTNNPSSEGWTGNINFDNENLSRLSLQPFQGNTSVRFRVNFESVTDVGATRYAGLAIDSVWIGNRNKVVLLEHFTNNENGGVLCNLVPTDINCSSSNDSVNKIKNLRPLDVAPIHYHTSFPYTDGFNLLNAADPSSRVLYYGVSRSPKTFLDGSGYASYGLGGGLDVSDADARSLVFSKFKLDLTVTTSGTTVNAATRITYNGSGTFNSDMVLHTVIVEAIKSENGKTYYHVMRKMLPDAAGNYISRTWTNGNSIELSSSWNAYDGNPNELMVVVFIQDYGLKSVHQAAFQKGAGSTGPIVITDINEISFNGDAIMVYPNPSSSEFNVLMSQTVNTSFNWELLDNLGNIVKAAKEESSEFSVHTNNISNGLYTLKITNKKGLSVYKKVIVAH